MKRPLKCRKTRDTILILTNGKQTEKSYFNSITNYFKTMFSLKVEYKNNECDDLVKYASSIDKSSYNQIWCVFDIDESFNEGHLINAIKMAKQNGIEIAYSNESFEVWLLYHLTQNVRINSTRKTYIKQINDFLAEKDVNIKYQKNNLDLLKNEFIPNIQEAAQNAKKFYQKLEASYQKEYEGNTNYPIWNWKASTTVFRLIDALCLIPKNCREFKK